MPNSSRRDRHSFRPFFSVLVLTETEDCFSSDEILKHSRRFYEVTSGYFFTLRGYWPQLEMACEAHRDASAPPSQCNIGPRRNLFRQQRVCSLRSKFHARHRPIADRKLLCAYFRLESGLGAVG